MSGEDQEAARRASLARTVLEILDDWDLDPADQLRLLGLGDRMRPRQLIRLRNGEPLPEDTAVLRRASAILAIHRALQTMYPHSAVAADHWVLSRNPRFMGRTPLELMIEGGLDGMERVVRYLDGSADWG